MSNQVPNSFKAMLWKGQIDGLNDTFKIILMKSGFVFSKTAHHAYADVAANELDSGNGYTTGGNTLTGVDISVNDVLNRAEVTWSAASWNATGGSLVASGAIIYDDSTLVGSGDDYTDAIVAYKDAGGDITAVDGTPIVVSSIMETIEEV